MKIAIASLGVLNFYLGIERSDRELTFGTWVQVWRRQKSLASDLWVRMASSDPAGEHDGSSLYFGSDVLEDHLSNFEQYLNQAIDRFVDSITKAGGLKKVSAPVSRSAHYDQDLGYDAHRQSSVDEAEPRPINLTSVFALTIRTPLSRSPQCRTAIRIARCIRLS